MRPLAHAPAEEFHVVLLDVRGRLLRTERVALGSVSQCPVSPRDVLRAAIREGAHSVVFVHNHPSGDPSPSAEDADLTERLRAGAELVGCGGARPRDRGGGWVLLVCRGGALAQVNPCAGRPRGSGAVLPEN